MTPVIFHPHVQRDIDDALEYYNNISSQIEDRFWNEFCSAIDEIKATPEKFHIDQHTGYKRYNLKTFPYNILYIIYPSVVRIQVLRHNRRKETFGSYRKTK